MDAEDENEIKQRNSPSLSETTRKVFFVTNNFIVKQPTVLFTPALITIKGLYPPFSLPLRNMLNARAMTKNNTIPRKSCSVPIKLITMKEHNQVVASVTEPTLPIPSKLQKSISTPSSPITPSALQEPAKKKTKLTEKVSPIASTSTSTATTNYTKRPLIKKKKPLLPKPKNDEEEDEPMTKPMSITEKRKRQAKRADQVKIWKVREEREARQARLVIRRQIVNGTTKSMSETTTTVDSQVRKKKKRVKFNFEKNSVIELPLYLEDNNEENA